MPYLSTDQVLLSTNRLGELHVFFGFAFLGFKKARLPVGETTQITYKFINDEILEQYFRLLPDVQKFFSPFASSNPSNSWVSYRYASTSLQRVVKDTFEDAFLEEGRSHRGWHTGYVDILAGLMQTSRSSRIPVADLAVWLFRDRELSPSIAPERQLERWFHEEFHFTEDEYRRLCSPEGFARQFEITEKPYDPTVILNTFGWPEGSRPQDGAILKSLDLLNVGPVSHILYEPSARLNVLVGDNSVGKTFILDCAWWAMTGHWADYPVEPKDGKYRRSSEMSYSLSLGPTSSRPNLALYEPTARGWQSKEEESANFVFYARHDGSYLISDTLRSTSPKWRSVPSVLKFEKRQVWSGLTREDTTGRERHICNGLIVDLVEWQRDGAESLKARLFTRALKTIAEGTDLAGIGTPTKISNDSRMMPTIRMPYGEVPVVYASAGTQRALSIAYLLVWAWSEHAESAEASNRKPFSSPVILLDELEAHLHPKWQRRILPALMRMVAGFGTGIQPQVHVATHSPLVLASGEPSSETDDAIHHLALEGREVLLRSSPYQKHGTVDAWLTSDLFELDSARSREAEDAIENAKRLQLQGKGAKGVDVLRAHTKLQAVLPDDDEFWVRWNYFRRSFD